MKEKVAIIKPDHTKCNLSTILEGEFFIDVFPGGFPGDFSKYDVFIVSFCGSTIEEMLNYNSNIIDNKAIKKIFVFDSKFQEIASVKSSCTTAVFLPVSRNYLISVIRETINLSQCNDDVAFYRIQQQNIRQLQSIIKRFYKTDPELKLRVKHEFLIQSEANRKKMQILNGVKEGLKNDEFKLFYQPVVSLKDDKVAGFESLIRWIDKSGNIVPPDDFIPTVESSDLIFELTYEVIEQAVQTLKLWQEEYDIDDIRINVNISARHFHQEDLVETIERIAEEYNVPSKMIGIEMTESAFIGDMEKANINFLKLKSMNHVLYMDDFGTGYSSLSYLQHFPVSIIKIDKSFVSWMHIDEQSESIVKSIIALAHGLDMKVVAEGVEDAEHIKLLKEFGCEYAQGYYYSKPITSEEALKYVLKDKKRSES